MGLQGWGHLVPPVASSQTLWPLQCPSQTVGTVSLTGLLAFLPSALPCAPMFFHECMEKIFYSHNLKIWVSICTSHWNQNFEYGNYNIGGHLNFTGIHVINKNLYLLEMSLHFCTVVIMCSICVEIYQKGSRKRSCCFYSCCLMSLCSQIPGHVSLN